MKTKNLLLWIISGLLLAAPAYYFTLADAPVDILTGLGILLLAGILSTILHKRASDGASAHLARFACFLVAFTALLQVMRRMALVSDHPFPLYWSEGNRFYDYSTLFGGWRYITADGSKPSALITPGMALPWGLPFIFPKLSITTFRFYYQLMWILPALMLGWFAIKPAQNKQNHEVERIFFSLWTFAFLEQGPVYVPIILATILVVIAARQRLWVGIALVFGASLYAHFSRWTWSYAPGLWAGMLALLAATPEEIRQDWVAALRKPFLLGLAGLTGGLIVPMVLGSEMAVSLLDPAPFTARQPLLWYRLFPNTTFAPGILLGILWAAGPSMVFMVFQLIKHKERYHWLQHLAIAVAMAGFFVVGTIASAKIGGGSNLHNLDMFLVTVILSASAILNRGGYGFSKQAGRTSLISAACVLLAAAGPLSYALQTQPHAPTINETWAEDALLQVQLWVEKSAQFGEVLFIDHRQLLAFGYIEDVALVEEYEKKMLMEMAMSRQLEYFADFYQDLANQRFALIVNEPAGLYIKDEENAFGEENNAFVEWVSFPLLCNYFPVYAAEEVGLELLMPRTVLPMDDSRCAPYITAKVD